MTVIGQMFGRLTVVGEAPARIESGKRKRRYRCRCKCGGEAITTKHKLTSGHTKSCGCLQASARRVHGRHGTRTYRIWDAMVQRCHNSRSTKYYMYGGRGIAVCQEWRDFAGFLKDMGDCPAGDLSIERIDNDGDYEPENCRWATQKEQQRNTRRNHVVRYCGRDMSVAEAAEIAGVNRNKLYPLLNHRGMSIVEAIRHVGG